MLRALKSLMACVALAALLIVAGCAPAIKDGEVLSKNFVPAHDETTYQYDPATEGLKMDTDHIPDRWYVTFGKKAEDGKYRTRTVSVSQSTYERVQKGEWFNAE